MVRGTCKRCSALERVTSRVGYVDRGKILLFSSSIIMGEGIKHLALGLRMEFIPSIFVKLNAGRLSIELKT